MVLSEEPKYSWDEVVAIFIGVGLLSGILLGFTAFALCVHLPDFGWPFTVGLGATLLLDFGIFFLYMHGEYKGMSK